MSVAQRTHYFEYLTGTGKDYAVSIVCPGSRRSPSDLLVWETVVVSVTVAVSVTVVVEGQEMQICGWTQALNMIVSEVKAGGQTTYLRACQLPPHLFLGPLQLCWPGHD